MNMHNPPHPGSILREDVLPELRLTITDAAHQLGIARVTLSRLIHERSAVSPDMAIRLESWLGGPSAETWLRMQLAYDLWEARQKPRPKIEKVAA